MGAFQRLPYSHTYTGELKYTVVRSICITSHGSHGRVAIKAGKSGNFIFYQGKSGEREGYYEKSGKIREVLKLLLFHL